MQRVPVRQRRLRVGIALQLVYGTLVNAVLHDPGPIALGDARMEKELTRVFLGAVRLDVSGRWRISPECAPAASLMPRTKFDSSRFGGPVTSITGKRLQDLFPQDLQLQLGQAVADAAVDAEAEATGAGAAARGR